MSLYARYVLPRLTDLAMRQREVSRYRADVVPRARGRVLEIGVGSGLNLPYYGGVDALAAVDPSEPLLAMTREKLRQAPFPVALLAASAESLPLDAASVDSAVMTFTLCSIPDPLRALREIRRVLKPGGALHFAEHGLAPDPAVERWQHRLTPVWRRLAGGCHLDRPIAALIEAAGFEIEDLARGYAQGPRPMAYVYAGSAKRPA